MPNNATDYWSVEGVSLNQHCWSVTSWGGDARGLPPLRGTETVYAYRAGQEFRPKVPEARTITLSMYVNGLNLDGSYSSREDFQTNYAALRSLLWTPTRQIDLTRRWSVTDGTTVSQITATAKAQIANVMEPRMTGEQRATLDVDFLLSDPYFYGAPVTYDEIEFDTPFIIENPGDDVALNHLVVAAQGALGGGAVPYVQIDNVTNTYDTPHWMRYNAEITGASAVRMFPYYASALQALATDGEFNDTPTSVTGRMQHSGYGNWFALFPGENQIVVSVSGGTPTGAVTVTYQPPYV